MEKGYLMPGIERIVFDNGLVVLLKNQAHATTTLGLVRFKVGAMNETEENAGISHLTEHIIFKSETAKQVVEDLETEGANVNAFTSLTETEVSLETNPKIFPRLFKEVFGLVKNFEYVMQEFEKEKSVVLEEVENLKDNPPHKSIGLFISTILPDTPYGRPTEGTFKSVKGLTKEAVDQWQKKYYIPNNMVIAVVGKLNSKDKEEVLKEEVLDVIDKTFGRLEKGPLPSPPSQRIDLTNIRISKAISRKTDSNQIYLCLGYRVPGTIHKDVHKLRLLNSVFSSGMSSRMFVALRENHGIGYRVGTCYEEYPQVGVFYAYVDGFYKERFKMATRAILNEFKKIKRELVSEKELQRAKNQLIFHHRKAMEESAYVVGEMLDKEIQKDPYDFRRIPQYINKITRKEIRETACQYLIGEYTLTVLVPEGFSPF